MSVFRVEKNKNYTVMSNYHLRDENINLKSKGLLSIMLSLPDEWDYSIKGLSKITGEGRDSIRACLTQLERAGYLVRRQIRASNGRMLSETEYIIYECPNNKDEDIETHHPKQHGPMSDEPKSENPTSEKPTSDEPIQIKTKKANANQRTKSINLPINARQIDKSSIGVASTSESYTAYEQLIRDNVGYDLFVRDQQKLDYQLDTDELPLAEYDELQRETNVNTVDKVIHYMLSIVASDSVVPVTINSRSIPANIVKAKLLKTGYHQLKACVKALNSNPNIHNPRSYAISMLFNS